MPTCSPIRSCSAALSALAALLILLQGAPSAADPSSEAKAYYERATASYSLGRFADAAELYEKAFDLKPDPALLYDAAQSHRVAGNKQRALLLYQNYLRVYGSAAVNARDVQRFITELKEAIEADQRSASTPPVAPTNPDGAAASSVPDGARAAPEGPHAELVKKPSGAADAPSPRPLAKRPALWIGLAAGLVVVGAAVGLGVAFGVAPSPPAHTFGTVRF
jgi:tetratricopeptide (TPR) repeat protein